MRVLAFVGPSGTGKSYRAQLVARENNIHYIIDDGLLINENEVLAGTSAKKAPTKIETVKHALFIEEKEQADMKKAFKKYKPDSLLILGTSDKMIQKIIESLDLPPLEKTIYINEVATEEEMEKARNIRVTQGKHVIPVPTFEIKKDFSVSTLVVTNNEKYITMANEAVLLPKEAEGVAGVFGMVVFSQLFACLLSLARGYNPDEPIGLSKTTVTF